MSKNGHSEFFPTLFPKKTGINSEFRINSLLSRPLHSIKVICTEKNGHSEFFSDKKTGTNFYLTIFSKRTGTNSEWPKMAVLNVSNNSFQKDWYKFRMAKIFPKKTGINSEWPKMAILNFFQQFFPKRLV